MFGYVKPLKCELKLREWEVYRAAYCGLCHALSRNCGFAARFAVNYDLTFLALVCAAVQGETLSFEEKRCAASPLKKKCVCAGSPSLDYAADVTVLLTWWKLKDSVRDSSFIKGIPARLASLFLKRARRGAEGRYPELSAYIRSCLDELNALEAARTPSLDAAADTFARILRSLSGNIASPRDKRICGELFYHLGRYIYIIDAWDDLEGDLKDRAYNPIAERFGVRQLPLSEETAGELKETLAQSISAAVRAFELADTGAYHGIIENILTLGLANQVLLVEQGRRNKKEKLIHERPLQHSGRVPELK